MRSSIFFVLFCSLFRYSVWSVFPTGESVEVPCVERTVRLDSLRPATRYMVRVVARNKVGTSQQSPPLAVTTQQEKPAGYPLDFKVLKTALTYIRQSETALTYIAGT